MLKLCRARIKNSSFRSQGCHHRPIIRLGLVVSSATLPLCHPCQLHRMGCAQESYMDRVTTMWDHRQSRCVPCIVVRRWIRWDRTHQGMIHHPMGHPSEGQVVRLLRPGQNIPAFPGSRIVLSRMIDHRDTAYQRVLKFGTSMVPKLTKTTLVNTEVHHLIQYMLIRTIKLCYR